MESNEIYKVGLILSIYHVGPVILSKPRCGSSLHLDHNSRHTHQDAFKTSQEVEHVGIQHFQGKIMLMSKKIRNSKLGRVRRFARARHVASAMPIAIDMKINEMFVISSKILNISKYIFA